MIIKKDKIQSPVHFFEDGKVPAESVLYSIDNSINGPERFAITKNTDGGKYMRGNLLFYSLNGIEIYTEPNNIIFVDVTNNTLFIRTYEKVTNGIAPENPEQKQYILLYSDLGYEDDGNSSEEFPLRWEAVVGRRTAYDSIKVNAPIIDIDRSLVLVETLPFKDALSVRQFMEYLKNSDIINEEDFDINDFSGSDYI